MGKTRVADQLMPALLNVIPDSVVLLDASGGIVMANHELSDYLNRAVEQLIDTNVFDVLPLSVAKARKERLETVAATGKPVHFEDQHNGRWIANSYYPVKDASGTVMRVVSFARDITESKRAKQSSHQTEVEDITAREQAEQALLALSGRLIDSQEEECMRVARELHDGLGQAMALLGIELGKAAQATTLAAARKSIDKLSANVQTIARDLQQLSHRLHPSTLDHLGLSLAIKEHCEALAAHHPDLAIDFTASNVPRDVPNDVALSLFRIVQEALGNVVKHSGARKAQVVLVGDSQGLTLRIEDNGRGFDPEKAMAKGGLGLVSMSERMRIVGGSISIRPRPLAGTCIEADVPISQAKAA
jgi:PAS domain S-box-containing protein